jgi:hypothetical protein
MAIPMVSRKSAFATAPPGCEARGCGDRDIYAEGLCRVCHGEMMARRCNAPYLAALLFAVGVTRRPHFDDPVAQDWAWAPRALRS